MPKTAWDGGPTKHSSLPPPVPHEAPELGFSLKNPPLSSLPYLTSQTSQRKQSELEIGEATYREREPGAAPSPTYRMAAAFSRHLGAAAARHLAGAARAATRRDRDNDGEDVDLELGASSDSSSTDDEDGNGGAVGDGSNGNGGAVGDGSNGSAGAGGGGRNDDASGAGGDAGGVDPEVCPMTCRRRRDSIATLPLIPVLCV